MSTSALQGLEKLHIDQKTFDDLVALVGPVVRRIRPQANPSQLLMMALRSMVHGETIDAYAQGLLLLNILNVALCATIYPQSTKEFEMVAEDFETLWKVPNCVGAISVLRMRDGPASNHYNILLVIDAKMRILDAGVAYGPMSRLPYDRILPTVEVFAQGNSKFPSPKRITGSKEPKPFTFVGGQGLTAQTSIRVVSGDPVSDEEVRRGLRPAEMVLKNYLTRFGILKRGYKFEILFAAVSLHNYLVQKSTSYLQGLLAEDSDVADLMNKLQISAKEPEPTEEDWKDILRMDRGTFDFLMSRCGPRFIQEGCTMDPRIRLAMVLRFMTTGRGYTAEREKMFASTFLIFFETMEEYLRPMPFPVSKWKSVAKAMEQKWGIPNCLGGIATKRVDFKPFTPGQPMEETSAYLCFFTTADYGINFMNLQLVAGRDPKEGHMFAVDAAFSEYDFKYPRDRAFRGDGKAVPYVFVGGSDLEERPNLVVPSNPGAYSAEEMKRALRPLEITMEILTTRFGCFQSPMAVKSPMNMVGALLASCLVHNVLLEKNPEYVKEYKDSHTE